MVYVKRRETFSASHRLFNPSFSEQMNREVFDKCSGVNGHGHNYVLVITVAGEPQKETGYVIDLKKLKQLVRTEIVDKVDHRHLNHDVDFLSGIIPTAENLAKTFWNVLGIPYLNQYDFGVTNMSDCFTDKPDFKPYTAVPVDPRVFNPQVALDPLDEKFDWEGMKLSPMLDDPEEIKKAREKDKRMEVDH